MLEDVLDIGGDYAFRQRGEAHVWRSETVANLQHAARGKAFFLARRAGGNPETASCSSCHTSDPTKPGQTRAGQAIDPMAVSANADRFTDFAKDEKWFKRNCSTVLQRECTPGEKGDFISFMVDQ